KWRRRSLVKTSVALVCSLRPRELCMVGLTRKFSLSHLWSPPICIFELRREMRLTMDGAAEEDYVIEAAGPFDRLPFQAA
ncbi:hypothetical protein PIB30_106535, partial [Stylosanthes scabra]|nr:hypothetical protein [Stylosanthes scabra]